MSAAVDTPVRTPRRTLIVRSNGGHILTMEHVPHVSSLERTIKNLADKGAEEGYSVFADSADDAHLLFPKNLLRHADTRLFFSLLIRLKSQPQKAMTMTALATVAICRVLRRFLGKNVGIYWPNRVCCEGHVIACVNLKGALHPTDGTYDYLAVNVGAALPFSVGSARLLRTVSHIFNETAEDLREQVAIELLKELFSLYEQMERNRSYMTEYRALSLYDGAIVKLKRPRRCKARVLGIDHEGRLTVDMGRGKTAALISADDIRRIKLRKNTK